MLIRCEGCENNHLIADNLGWFEDQPVNIEQLMQRANLPHVRLSVDQNPQLAQALQGYLNLNNDHTTQQSQQNTEQKQDNVKDNTIL